MKFKILFFLLVGSSIFGQLTVADYLKEIYPNYKYIMEMPYIELSPQPNTTDFQNKSLTEILSDKNKFTYKTTLSKEILRKRLNNVLTNNSIFSNTIIKDDGANNFVINADITSNFNSAFAGYVYQKKSFSKIKIRVKDFAYQIEVYEFKVGKNDSQNFDYKHILRENNKEYNNNTVGGVFKKELQQDWNNTFVDFLEKFAKLNNLVNETNDF